MKSISAHFLTVFIIVIALTAPDCNFLNSHSKPKYFVETELSINDLIRNLSNNPDDTALNKALEAAHNELQPGNKDFVALFGQAFQKNNPGKALSYLFTKPSAKGITGNTSDDKILAIIIDERKHTLKRVFEILKQRGTTMRSDMPDMDLVPDEAKGVITIGFYNQNYKRTLDYLMTEGRLQFFETYTNIEMAGYLRAANNAMAESMENNGNKPKHAVAEPGSKAKEPATANSTDTARLGDLIKPNQENSFDRLSSLLKQLVIQDSAVSSPVIGYFSAHDRKKLMHYLSLKLVRDILPPDVRFVPGAQMPGGNSRNEFFPMYAVKMLPDRKAPLEGDKIVNARADYSPITGKPDIDMDMTIEGAHIWEKMTGRNIGKYIAIVFDDVVFSCPRVDGEISNGSTEISGSFRVDEAQDMANLLKSGNLSTPLKIVRVYEADSK